jgi:sugar phosphate isomerase/epimerase
MSVMKSFRLSVITDELSQDFDLALDTAKDFGIEAVEVRSIWNKNIALLPGEDLDRMKAALDRRQMRVSVISSPFGKCFLPKSWLAAKSGTSLSRNPSFNLGLFDHLVELADFFGTKYIRIFAFFKDSFTITQEKWHQVVENLQPYIDRAEEAKKILLVENEHVCYTDTIANTLQFFEKLQSPALKLNLDPGNFYSAKEPVTPEAYDVFYQKKLVEHMHIKDPQYRIPAIGSNFAAVGTGKIDYRTLIKQAEAYGFTGWYTLETHTLKNKLEVSKKSLTYLHDLLKSL